jgi:quinol monooxygenase YgiN
MIVVSGTLTIDPAKADLAQELTDKLVAETRKEEGNVAYEYSRSHADPGRWRVFEEWASEDALNEHMASPHMAEFMGAAGDLGITGADIQRYDVSEKSKLM